MAAEKYIELKDLLLLCSLTRQDHYYANVPIPLVG